MTPTRMASTFPAFVSPYEAGLIIKIAERIREHHLTVSPNSEPPRVIDVAMDLECVHMNGCPLALELMLTCPTYDLFHDALGIAAHLDRATGQLAGFFEPRCALSNHTPRSSAR